MASEPDELNALLQQQRYAEVGALCERKELELSPEFSSQTWPFATHLAGLLFTGDLCAPVPEYRALRAPPCRRRCCVWHFAPPPPRCTTAATRATDARRHRVQGRGAVYVEADPRAVQGR